MMKWLKDYRTIIVDFDGTLYYQRPVRAAMLMEMMFHFWRFPDYLIVKKYRELYERGLREDERYRMLPKKAPDVIREWMVERPLKYIARFQDHILLEKLRKEQMAGKTVIVYSDYTVKEKLKALGYVPTLAISSEEVGCMKPDAAGLIRVLSEERIKVEDCIVIGDREEKDAELARNMGINHILLPVTHRMRRKFYQNECKRKNTCIE